MRASRRAGARGKRGPRGCDGLVPGGSKSRVQNRSFSRLCAVPRCARRRSPAGRSVQTSACRSCRARPGGRWPRRLTMSRSSGQNSTDGSAPRTPEAVHFLPFRRNDRRADATTSSWSSTRPSPSSLSESEHPSSPVCTSSAGDGFLNDWPCGEQLQGLDEVRLALGVSTHKHRHALVEREIVALEVSI